VIKRVKSVFPRTLEPLNPGPLNLEDKLLKNHKELKVWQKAYELCLKIYKLTEKFPKEERFGLVAQIRRSAVSIPSNIAEGYNRGHRLEYVQFLNIAYGSLNELDTQLLLSKDLSYASGEEVECILEDLYELERMLAALIRSLKKK